MSSLINRNVFIGPSRTSMRLEPEFWSALEEICHREGCTLSQLVEKIEKACGAASSTSRTSAVRTYAFQYFRDAATDPGHKAAGHGKLGALAS